MRKRRKAMANDDLWRQGREMHDRIMEVLDGKSTAVAVYVLTNILAGLLSNEPRNVQRRRLAMVIDMLKDRIAEPLQ